MNKAKFLCQQNNFFFRPFGIKVNSALFGIALEKNYSNLTKIFVLRLFKMVTNQTECSGLEQKSVSKFLVAERCTYVKFTEVSVMCTK